MRLTEYDEENDTYQEPEVDAQGNEVETYGVFPDDYQKEEFG
jgi:hypothetical protein